jgi:glucuronosyltransferase
MGCALLLTLCVLFHATTAARILGLSHFNGRSMYVVFATLMKELASRGHQVTMVSHFPQKTPIPNFRDININNSFPALLNNISYDSIRNLNTAKGIMDFLFVDDVEKCRAVLEHPSIQQLINSTEKYDLVIIQGYGTDCLLGFAHIFDTPIILMVSNQIFPWMNDRVGNPDNPAYIPNIFVPYTPNMTFLERVWNTIISLELKWKARASEREVDVLARKHFGGSLPPLRELTKKTSLIFVNSHFSIQMARPTVPAIVDVGGIHIEKPKRPPEVNIIKMSDKLY